MKVREFIELLKKYDPELEVKVWQYRWRDFDQHDAEPYLELDDRDRSKNVVTIGAAS